MKGMGLVLVVSGMVTVAAFAQSSNDVALLKFPATPGTKVLFGDQEVTDAGLAVAPGTTAALTLSSAGGRPSRREGFTVVRTADELKAYELPPVAASQDLVRASSGVVTPMLAGLSVQIDRAIAMARAELATQSAGSTTVSDKTVATTNGVVRERIVRTTTNATVAGSRIERIVWCAENGAVRVFISAPRGAVRPDAPAR